MKVFLLYKNRNFNLQVKLPSNEKDLIQDLGLNALFDAMAMGDEFLFEVAKKIVLTSENDLDTILYRQDILRDCLKNPGFIRDIYTLASEAIEKEKKAHFGFFSKYPSSILYNSIEALEVFLAMLKKLRMLIAEHETKFQSEGFVALFTMLKKELSDEYLAVIQTHLNELKIRDGLLISAKLGKGNKGTNYTLRKQEYKKQSWIQRIFEKKVPVYVYRIPDRDENGLRALSELRDRGINTVANALAQSVDHIRNFFITLLTELAFYIGCLNLYEQLTEIGEHISFPLPFVSSERRHSFKGLYDVCLALNIKQKIIDNDLNADHKNLFIITGANQGGKSTFLRSIGLAQLMMQCGMFVPAQMFSSNICEGIYTVYKREEDITMRSGKLDEELSRMNSIVDNITSNSLLLFNEPFTATNEREGSEIARQIISALYEKRIKVFVVTHLYSFAHNMYEGKMDNAVFLRAERRADGERTFKLREGEPLQTSFGEDLYNRIFVDT